VRSPVVREWLLVSRLGRALRWRAVHGWAWLSLQLVAFFLTTRVGHLVGSLEWPLRIAVLIPVVLVLFGIADVVSDAVDSRLCCEDASAGGAAEDQVSS
jgi:hypothetical protein